MQCTARGYGSLGFESASTLVRDAYVETVYDAAPVVAGSSVAGFVEHDDDWNLEGISLSTNVNVHASQRVEFTVIQTRCCDLSPAVPDKACDVFGLALRVLMRCWSRWRLGHRMRYRKEVEQSI